jgi:hypothetical protein
MDNRNYSKGISWINDCRIPFVDEGDKGSVLDPMTGIKGYKHTSGAMTNGISRMDAGNPQGRFPANILVSDDMLNDGNIGQNNSKNQEWGLKDDFKVNEYLIGLKKSGISRIADKGSNSRYYNIDKWFNNLIDV